MIFLLICTSGCEKDKKMLSTEQEIETYTGGCPAGGVSTMLDFVLIDMYSGKNMISLGSGFKATDVVITAGFKNAIMKPAVMKNREIGQYFRLSPALEFIVTVKNLPSITVKVTYVIKNHPDRCPTAENVKVEYSGRTLTDVADKVVKILVDTKR